MVLQILLFMSNKSLNASSICHYNVSCNTPGNLNIFPLAFSAAVKPFVPITLD